MSRHNFISRETFIETTETQAKVSLLSIPVFATHIKFVAESKMLQSFKFLYKLPKSNIEYIVDITILPVNDHICRVGLKGKYINGQSFTDDTIMEIVLKDIEAALIAAIKSDTSLYKPYVPKESKSRAFIHFFSIFTSFDNLFFSRRSSLKFQQTIVSD